MKVSLLYRVFFIGIAVVVGIGLSLWLIQNHVLPKQEASETSPTHSALSEVEFESGARAELLKKQQTERLNTYSGNPAHQSAVSVPVTRAIDYYVEHAQ